MQKIIYINLTLLLFFSLISCKDKHENKQSIPSDTTKVSNQNEVKVDSTELRFKSLSKKSIEYNRFKRNEIFAKKGYIFSDSCLAKFYENFDWYKPTSKNIILTYDEKKKVGLFKKVEGSYHSKNTPMIIVFSQDFIGYPLFYIAWNQANTHLSDNLYYDGGFFLLPKELYWTLSCHGIPPEFIIENALHKVEIIDEQVPIEKSDVKLINYDKSCRGGNLPELLIYLEGPSDDYAHVIIGFDNDDKFKELYSAGIIDKHEIENDSTLILYTEERCDYFGTQFCTRKYSFNTITKNLTVLPFENNEIEGFGTSNDYVDVYESKEGAENRNSELIKGKIPPNTGTGLIKYRNNNSYLFVETDSISGWINIDDFNKFTFT